MAWDPAQYLRFSDDRLRPAIDLLERIPLESPRLVFDLGCGAGNVTRLVAQRWPSARVVGVDNSPEMLERAKAQSDPVQWVLEYIERWSPGEAPDLVYSNAALHWVPGHDEVGGRTRVLLRRTYVGLDGHPTVLEERVLETFPSDEPGWEARFTEAMSNATGDSGVISNPYLSGALATTIAAWIIGT